MNRVQVEMRKKWMLRLQDAHQKPLTPGGCGDKRAVLTGFREGAEFQ